jgi:hypothetical protein
MMFLERNLEQLTVVQRQLVEQNSSLKKEVAIAERKLIARNERIQSLESLLQDSQEKLTAANHRCVPTLCTTSRRPANCTTVSKHNSRPSKSASNPPKRAPRAASEVPQGLAPRLRLAVGLGRASRSRSGVEADRCRMDPSCRSLAACRRMTRVRRRGRVGFLIMGDEGFVPPEGGNMMRMKKDMDMDTNAMLSA